MATRSALHLVAYRAAADSIRLDPGYMRRGIAAALIYRIVEVLRARVLSGWR